MNTCHRYIWYEKQCKVSFVIQYHWNVFSQFTMNIYQYKFYFIRFIILTNNDTQAKKKQVIGYVIVPIIADATSGREKLWKNFI